MKNKSNLTGGQIENVMDTLLHDCLREIVENTGVFDVQLTYLLSLITSNKKRKPHNAANRDRAISLLIRALSVPRDQKMQYIMEVKMERNFIYMFLQNVINRYYHPYVDLYRKYLVVQDPDQRRRYQAQLDAYVRTVGAESRSKLFVALNNLNDLLPVFMSYFHTVVDDFYRLCTQHAKFYVDTNRGKQYDSKDVRQNFLRNVIIAINKYDSSRGAIVSYVKWWILNAQTCSSSEHEYGIAYTIPQTQRKKLASGQDTTSVNFSVSLDAPASESDEGMDASLHHKVSDSHHLEDTVDSGRRAEKIGLLIKRIDPMGIARLTMDIPEVFEPEERQHMRNHMLKQGLLNK
ncbi:putative RpoD subfamily RNA polymerase, sigma70 subunit [Erwinia phage pEa_SNUABM_5]|uniref:Putative RpoD subfamily RNA polymerase, sigma70 subunit n=1 Tax=Erwinia phage pEa_SNUABM_5 TaxID=2797313 RepID=A0A7T8IVR4_9CAUD|nr:putative RpoD subfamily RNA polymerase, sigma70 subunit [Erwinia phage pEa_SNUABM_5]QQO90390.1 putative RpoD subfamily RNA polymerase, sigma70 subunit [Erwinia phage pEa_SNUABM_5]